MIYTTAFCLGLLVSFEDFSFENSLAEGAPSLGGSRGCPKVEPYTRGSGSSGKACVRKSRNTAQGEEEETRRMRNSGMGNAKAKGIPPWRIMYSLQLREGSDWSKQNFPEGAAAPVERALGREVQSQVHPGKG